MPLSMTGFGRGEASGPEVDVTVELKAVNHRFLDVQLRVPREYVALEADVQRALKDRLRRGRVEATVRRQGARGDAVVVPDVALFRSYLEAFERLLGGRGSDAERSAAIAHALAQPGVLSLGAPDVDAAVEAPVLLDAVARAIDALQAMRVAEGRQLAADLQRHLAALIVELDAIDDVVADLGERLRDRLVARIGQLVAEQVEPARLAQEAAFAADKADVSEEIARLRSHVVQLRDALTSDDAVGRRLDFLLQEVGREINTIGSKAVDHPVSARVVEMKTLLERMREQAANVE